jgi:hypothetical protein
VTTAPRAPGRPLGFRFNRRAFVSSLTAIAFAAMTVSGVVIFAVPSGRVARAIEWSFLGLARDDWIAVHIGFAVLFVVAGAVHLAFNWRAMRHHVAARLAEHVRVRPEPILALLLAALVLAAAVERWPPFDYVFSVHKALKTGDESGPPAERPRRGRGLQEP